MRKECLNQRCANCKLESARVERRCSVERTEDPAGEAVTVTHPTLDTSAASAAGDCGPSGN